MIRVESPSLAVPALPPLCSSPLRRHARHMHVFSPSTETRPRHSEHVTANISRSLVGRCGVAGAHHARHSGGARIHPILDPGTGALCPLPPLLPAPPTPYMQQVCIKMPRTCLVLRITAQARTLQDAAPPQQQQLLRSREKTDPRHGPERCPNRQLLSPRHRSLLPLIRCYRRH